MKKFGEFGVEGINLEEIYKNGLEEKANQIEYEGQDSRKIEIIVYELDGVTVRTEFKTEDKDYTLDLDTTNGKNLSIKEEKLTDEGSDIKLFALGKASNENNVTRTIKYNDMYQNLEINLSSQNQENQLESHTNINFSNEQIANLNIDVKTDYTIANEQQLPEKFDERNNILLNNYEGDRIISIVNNLKDLTIKKLEEKQLKINTKLLNNILNLINQKQQQIDEEEKNNAETQKERFNNKFILYQGTDIKYEDVQNLLNVVGQNMSDYKVLSGNEIQILIEEGTNNKEKAEKISEVLSDRHTYNIVMNYSTEGYINSINISVYEEER